MGKQWETKFWERSIRGRRFRGSAGMRIIAFRTRNAAGPPPRAERHARQTSKDHMQFIKWPKAARCHSSVT